MLMYQALASIICRAERGTTTSLIEAMQARSGPRQSDQIYANPIRGSQLEAKVKTYQPGAVAPFLYLMGER